MFSILGDDVWEDYGYAPEYIPPKPQLCDPNPSELNRWEDDGGRIDENA